MVNTGRKSSADIIVNSPYWNEQGQFKAMRLANEIIKERTFKTMEDTDQIYVYDEEDGIYYSNGETVIKKMAQEMIIEELGRNRLKETIMHVKISTYTPREEFNKHPNLIHLKNGIYDINANKLQPHTPEIISTSRLPVSYNLKAKCPNFLKFTREVIEREDRLCMQEAFGYCLYRGMPFHKAIMLYGSGSNGKSTMLNVLKELLGTENLTSIALQDLEGNKFGTASLYGKLVNIYSDLPDKALQHTGKFKMLTGGDLVQAEQKFKSPFHFVNYAKFFFSANKLPDTYDDSDAFFRRWLIIIFRQIFEEGIADHELLTKLTTDEELSGILNWSVEGLKRLMRQKRFTSSKSVADLRDDYNKKANPLKAFIKDSIIEDSSVDGYISKEEFYAKFSQYCKDVKLPVKSKDHIGKNIQKVIPNVTTGQKTINNKKGVWCWFGIKLGTKETLGSLPFSLLYTTLQTPTVELKVKEKVVNPVTDQPDSLVESEEFIQETLPNQEKYTEVDSNGS